MENIKKSILAVLSVEENDTILKDFAHNEFIKYCEKRGHKLSSVWFNGYEILNKKTIRVKYQYGGSDMDGKFDVVVENDK